MADDKSNKSKNDPDSSKTGNSCGLTLGCLVIIIAVGAVVFFLFIKPALEEAGYSYEDLKEQFFDFKDKADDTIQKTKDAYQEGKEKIEDIKDTGEEHWQDVKETNDQVQEELDKSAPELVRD